MPTNLLSRRCIILSSLILSVLIYQFYSASIVGSLLMEKPKTIKTLRDLIDSPLQIGLEDIGYTRDYFRVSFHLFTCISFVYILLCLDGFLRRVRLT